MSFWFETLLAQKTVNTIDSSNSISSIDYKIDSIWKSQKPLIKFNLYRNGKKIKNRFSISLILNDSTIKMKKNRILLNRKTFNDSDTIKILVWYKKDYFFKIDPFAAKKMKYGGQIDVGVILNFSKELAKYNQDTLAYFDKNQNNKLYRIISRSSQKFSDIIQKNKTLAYSITNFYTTNFLTYKLELIDNKYDISN